MATFLHDMKALGLQNRTVALVENGSWAPVSGKLMREMLGELKGFQVLEPVVSLKSALKDSSLGTALPAQRPYSGLSQRVSQADKMRPIGQ